MGRLWVRVNRKEYRVRNGRITVPVPPNRHSGQNVLVPVELLEYQSTKFERNPKHTTLFLVFTKGCFIVCYGRGCKGSVVIDTGPDRPSTTFCSVRFFRLPRREEHIMYPRFGPRRQRKPVLPISVYKSSSSTLILTLRTGFIDVDKIVVL